MRSWGAHEANISPLSSPSSFIVSLWSSPRWTGTQVYKLGAKACTGSHFQTHDYHGSYCISLLFYKISPAQSFWKISPCSGDLSLLPIFTKYKIINSDEKNASLVTPHLPLYLVNTAYLFISDHLPLRRTNYKTEFYENHSGAFMLEL